MCVSFLKYLINFFSTNFILIDVSRKQLYSNSLGKCLLCIYTIITEKSLWRLTFQSAMLNVYIFYFAVSFFGLRR